MGSRSILESSGSRSLLNVGVVDKELMQSLSSGNHGKNGNLLVNNNLNKNGALVCQHLLETGLELINVSDSDTLHAHGLSELHEIGVLLMGVAVSVLVEKGLPLSDHTLLLVVEHNSLDANVELNGGGQLGKSHVERSITIDVNDVAVGSGNLGADSGGKTVAHGSKTTGGDHGSGMSPSEVLGGPHLMLANTGGDDGLVLVVLGQVGEHGDDGLGLDDTVLALSLEHEGELLLPRLNNLRPGSSLGIRDGGDERNELSHALGNVSLNSLGGLNNLVDVLGLDLKVHDTSSALKSGLSGLGGKLGDGAGDSIVESSTKGDDTVGVLHGHVGVAGAVHTEHVESLRVSLVEGTKTLQGGGDGDLGLLGKLLEQLGALLVAENTLSDVEDGLLGHVDEVGGSLDGLLLELVGGSRSQVGERVRGDGGLGGDGLSQDGGGDILGQVDQNGAGSARGGNLKGLVDSSRELGDVLDHDVPLGARSGDSDNVGLLEGVSTDNGGQHLAGEDNHGGTVRKSVLHGCDDVGGTGAGGDENDTGLAGGTCVALGHVAGALLVSGEHKVEVLGVVNSVKDGENGTTGVAEDGVDVVSQHHLVEDLSTGEADEGVVHVGIGGLGLLEDSRLADGTLEVGGGL